MNAAEKVLARDVKSATINGVDYRYREMSTLTGLKLRGAGVFGSVEAAGESRDVGDRETVVRISEILAEHMVSPRCGKASDPANDVLTAEEFGDDAVQLARLITRQDNLEDFMESSSVQTDQP